MNRTALLAISGLAASSALGQPCGTPWSQGPSSGPSARNHAALSYDSTRGRIVLFGGYGVSIFLGDTWEWTASGAGGGGSWALAASTGPTPRYDVGLAYDAARQKTVLFGGLAGSQVSNQTWEWNGSAWSIAAPAASPPAMEGNLMAYDTSRQRIVLVSSIDNGSSALATWEYDGATWVHMPDTTPRANWYEFAMGYDAARSKMVLVGKIYGTSPLVPGTWERDAGGWALRTTGTVPYYYTTSPKLAFDSTLAQIVFDDNGSLSGKTGIWAWNGTTASWTFKNSTGPARFSRSVAYDSAGHQLVLFGGTPYSGGGPAVDETWLYRSDVRSGPELTDTGVRDSEVPLSGPPTILSVTAVGSGTITYQWRLNQVDLFEGGAFTGTTTPQLSINPNDVAYSGDYDAVVTDSCGTTIRPATHVLVRCYANCDNSMFNPRLNAEDFQCFLNMYAAALSQPIDVQIASYGNCDHSTNPPVLNANDFQCFMNAFAAGCQ